MGETDPDAFRSTMETVAREPTPLILLLILLLLQPTGQGAPGADDPRPPPGMRERLASDATLPCLLGRLPAPSLEMPSAVRWTRVPSGSAAGERLVLEAVDGALRWGEGFQGRAGMPGYSRNQSDASLILTELRSSDSATYRCEIAVGLDGERHSVSLVVTGAVFHYRAPSARGGLSFYEAQQACLENSARVASPAQLISAFWDGYESCDAGWLSDHTVSVSVQSPRPGCRSDGDGSPGVRSLGPRDPGERFDVYCYTEDLRGEVFHSTVPGKLSLARAVAHCRALGARLATAGQLHLAWRAGLDRCDPGWLADGTVRYPITRPRAGCGGAEPGIRTLYRDADLTGVPSSSALFDAYCYREQEGSEEFGFTESRLPASRSEAGVTPPPSSSSNHEPEPSDQMGSPTSREQEGAHRTALLGATGSRSKPGWSGLAERVGPDGGPHSGSAPETPLPPAAQGKPGSHGLIAGEVDAGEDEGADGRRGKFSSSSTDGALPTPRSTVDATAPPATAAQVYRATGGAGEPRVPTGEGSPAEESRGASDRTPRRSTADAMLSAGSTCTSAPGPVGDPSAASLGVRHDAQRNPVGPEDSGQTISLVTVPLATAASTEPPEGYSGEDRDRDSSVPRWSEKESDGSGLVQPATPLGGSSGEAWNGKVAAEVRGEVLFSRQSGDTTISTFAAATGPSLSPPPPVAAQRLAAEDDGAINGSLFREDESRSAGSEESFAVGQYERPPTRGRPQAPRAQPPPPQPDVQNGTGIPNGTQLSPDVDDCRSNPCQNGGTCIDKADSFVCLCMPSYGGATCEKDTEGCEHGWRKFHGRCYRYFPRRHAWESAEKDCREHSAHLASVHSAAEQDFLTGLSRENTWIGLNDRTVEDDFQWTDNTELEYESWQEKQPDNFFAGGEDCVVTVAHEDGRWNDVPCNYNLPYICKKGTVLCGAPPAVENAFLMGRRRERYDVHSVVRYQCADGFLQHHVPTAKCRANGRWDRPRIACTKAGRRSHRHRRHHHKSHRERRKHRQHGGGAHDSHAHSHTHM
ncbi:neurocan core protein-like isoform X1 [Scleropages formosus]|uniref:neurocan core protein-like isoform X1 n=1 Tax=Scleropages formosus TaxID=113540 RepID=UPI0010FA7EFF|nr:neurocan core protein-like isoform X1 [Scleropages formosus]